MLEYVFYPSTLLINPIMLCYLCLMGLNGYALISVSHDYGMMSESSQHPMKLHTFFFKCKKNIQTDSETDS